jgi:hypothetical protein
MTKSLSDTHYLDVFFFEGSQVKEHRTSYHPEKEAHEMFLRGKNKYKGTDKKLLMVLRTIEHELIKSEKINL